jgi:hypothetical protein
MVDGPWFLVLPRSGRQQVGRQDLAGRRRLAAPECPVGLPSASRNALGTKIGRIDPATWTRTKSYAVGRTFRSDIDGQECPSHRATNYAGKLSGSPKRLTGPWCLRQPVGWTQRTAIVGSGSRAIDNANPPGRAAADKRARKPDRARGARARPVAQVLAAVQAPQRGREAPRPSVPVRGADLQVAGAEI